MTTLRSLSTFLTLALTINLGAQNILVSLDSADIPDVNLGEVVIAASRDNSKIKDIPNSITSIRSSQIENNQIQSLEDVSTFAPNFMMLDYGTKIMSPVYIRGIGSRKTTVAPSVGLYVDGIPFFDNSALSFDFYDISQIEILRGPQGTLYGRNTIGGLININTLSPMSYQGTNVSVTAEQYGAYNANIGHYGKVGNNFAYSIAASYRYQDGYFENKYDSTMADEMESYGLRNRLIYQATDKFSIENIFSFESSTQEGYPYAAFVDSSQSIGDVNYNSKSGYERLMINEGLIFKYEEENWVADATLSYQNVDDRQQVDQDFKPNNYFFVDQNQNQNLYSGEAMIRSKENKTYNWIFGAFGLQHQLDKDVSVNYYAPLNTIYQKDLLFKDYHQVNTSAGIFHQSKYNPVKNLFIEAGLRLNYEKSTMDYIEQKTFTDVTTTLADTTYSPLTDFVILPKVAISYKYYNSTVYASYSTGYKPGGFNSTFEEENQIQFEKESSHNYEIGLKTDILSGLIYSDFTLFLSEIKGQQIARSLRSQTGTYLENSGESRNKGLEFSLNTSPINGFEASVSYGYTFAEIISYQKNDSTNFAGNITPYVPNHTLNISIAQTIETTNINYLDNIRFQMSLQQVGDIYWNIENEEMQDAYNTINALLSLRYKGAKLDFWGKNLLDTQYSTIMFKTSSWFGQKGLPQRFGTTLSMKF